MMDSMRNAARTWVAKLLIGLLAVSFAVWGISDVFRGFGSGALAKVGGVEVTAADFQRSYDQYLRTLAQQTGQQFSPEDARRLGIDRAILENLVQSAALDDAGRRMKLGIPDAFLVEEVAANPAFQNASGQFDKNLFLNLLRANGISETEFFASERRNRLREALTGTADGNVIVPRATAEAHYRHRNEQRDARYFTVTTGESEVTAPTDDEIRAEYDANPAAYTAPEYRAIAVMKVEPADITARITLTDAEVAAGYERLKQDYFTPERRTILQLTFPSLEEARAAHARIVGGEDFRAIARERGFTETDITFADKARSDFLDPAIAQAAFSLAEGALSEPIKGALTTALIKVEKISPERQASLEEVKAQLAERLKMERAREEIQSVYDAVEDARAAQTSFEDIAARADIPFLLVEAVDASGRDKAGKELDLPHRTELLRAVFGSDVGVENDALLLDDGYVWYEVRSVTPSAVRPLDEVREQVRAAVLTAKLRTLSGEKARKLVERARSGATLDELARESGAEILSMQGLRRNERSGALGSDAVAALFSVPENGFAFAVDPDGRSAKVMQSQAVLLPAYDPASADVKAIVDQLRQATGDDLLSAYLAALEKDAGVTVNETLWRQITGTAAQ